MSNNHNVILVDFFRKSDGQESTSSNSGPNLSMFEQKADQIHSMSDFDNDSDLMDIVGHDKGADTSILTDDGNFLSDT